MQSIHLGWKSRAIEKHQAFRTCRLNGTDVAAGPPTHTRITRPGQFVTVSPHQLSHPDWKVLGPARQQKHSSPGADDQCLARELQRVVKIWEMGGTGRGEWFFFIRRPRPRVVSEYYFSSCPMSWLC